MTSQLKQAIDIAQSLSLAEQLELLKTLSAIIQRTHSLETQATTTTDRPHPQCWGTNEVKPVTPSDVAQWIRQAMQLEWQIAAIGNTFEVRIAGGRAEKIY